MTDTTWQPIDTAPKNQTPVWVRGWDWGRSQAGKRHYCWAYWDGSNWIEAKVIEPATLDFLTDWRP